MPGRLKARHIAAVSVIFALLVFQNCDSAPSNDAQNQASSYQQQLPFAYNPVVDTIAYMSCSEISDTSFEPRAYFSFRAGAYNSATGGLTLTDPFRTQTQYYNPTNRGQLLNQSDTNASTLLNFSIRSAGNYQSIWATQSVTQGNEIDQFLPELDTPQIEGPLAATSEGQYVNYFPGDETQRLMEASLRFLQFENVANDTRNNLANRTSILVVGFSNTADVLDQNLRSPVDFTINGQFPPTTPPPGPVPSEQNQVYGIGYLLSFDLPQGYTAGDRRVLSSGGIQEMDLSTGNVRAANWNCSQSYEFMVIRPEDKAAGTVICNATVDSYANSTQQAELSAIRRVLRVEDWWVDLNNRCVMPKGTGDFCYGSTLGTRTIQYGQSACADGPTTVCPHFVSICIRN